MKKNVFTLIILTTLFSLVFSCKPGTIIIPEYTITIDATKNVNAPALQSFAHGIHGDEWLLFAGRTNQNNDNGGLHDMTAKSDYAEESFPPTSFNEVLTTVYTS